MIERPGVLQAENTHVGIEKQPLAGVVSEGSAVMFVAFVGANLP